MTAIRIDFLVPSSSVSLIMGASLSKWRSCMLRLCKFLSPYVTGTGNCFEVLSPVFGTCSSDGLSSKMSSKSDRCPWLSTLFGISSGEYFLDSLFSKFAPPCLAMLNCNSLLSMGSIANICRSDDIIVPNSIPTRI